MVESLPPMADAPAAREPRYPCVGIALLYSARDDQGQPGLGLLLHRAATHDMSLKGLSFDVSQPLSSGTTLMVVVGQPEDNECEQLRTVVRWCRGLAPGHFRVGVQIEQSARVRREALDGGDDAPQASLQVGLPVPSSVELTCPACGQHSVFELVGNQSLAGRAGLMPLYDCAVCETTRSIMGLLAYARQADATAVHPHSALPITRKEA